MQRTLVILLQVALAIALSCSRGTDQAKFKSDLEALQLIQGDISLCTSGEDSFGTVSFSQACSDAVRKDFNLAISLLHSFEYLDAEKVFARIIETDPDCLMAYWGAAMANFHPLWGPPAPADLAKGAKIIALGRSIRKNASRRESDYLEAVAAIYENWQKADYRTRVLRYEAASKSIFQKYREDEEAAIFYALALNAAADPNDKTFVRQREAGKILNNLYENRPRHPGIVHYLIHTYDYPELAALGLPAARRYASIAPASAHAQHMPSHIFTRLGLWDESIETNLNSVSSARCFAEQSGSEGHWDEELHGLDYLMYAYLQKGSDDQALEIRDYVASIEEVFPVNFKDAYCFAAVPARYALERRDWKAASMLQALPSTFPWENFPWEVANIHFARALAAVHLNDVNTAKKALKQLEALHKKLIEQKEAYKANLVSIQIKGSQAWIAHAEGNIAEALMLMEEAADMEDATAKHPVTPGEIIPARELLGDLLLEMNMNKKALAAYEMDLSRHPNRFNGLLGAMMAAQRSNEKEKAERFHAALQSMTKNSVVTRDYVAPGLNPFRGNHP